jgi:hypothetical protein
MLKYPRPIKAVAGEGGGAYRAWALASFKIYNVKHI